MSKHKKQHFVPKSYLAPWCDPNCPKKQTPYVWRFSQDGKEAKRKAPENIFHEADMYTIHRKDGAKDLRLEQGLQQLETRFSSIRRNVLNKKRTLTEEEHLQLCMFIAATHSRTKANRDHWKKNWERPLRRAEDMMKWAETATDDQIKQAASIAIQSIQSQNRTMTYEQLKELHENTIQIMLPMMIETVTPLLLDLNMTIFCTNNSPGFITSDYPCVWFDPEGYKKPPIFRSPCFSDPKLEITLPVSPNQAIILSRHDYRTHYLEVNDRIVNELNRRTRFNADEYFIVNSNTTDPYWFDPGEEPKDSWENVRSREQNANK